MAKEVNPPIIADDEKWLVWSLEHRAWWKPGRRGYTEVRSEAGRYSFAEAEEIVRSANRYKQKDPGTPFEAMVPEDKLISKKLRKEKI